MTIFIDLGNQLLAEALSQLLVRAGYDHVVRSGGAPANGFVPDVLLVDGSALRHELFARYPEAKVLLIDTGIEPENLPAMLLPYRIHGVLSPHTEIHHVKKALKVVSTTAARGKTKSITGREQEMVASVCQGLTNQEIADRFGLSPYTVRAHLYRIYKKLGVRSRSKLMAQAMHSPHVTSP